MDEFLSLCDAASDDGGEDSSTSESYLTAPTDFSMDSARDATDLDSFMSVASTLLPRNSRPNSANESGTSSSHERTITEDVIQSKIEELCKTKEKIIEQARATVFGSGAGVSKENKPSGSGARLVDLDFDAATQSFELSVSERATLFDSDSSDDEMTDNKKDLSATGKQLQKRLKKLELEREASTSALRPPTPVEIPKKAKQKETVLTGIVRKECVAATVFDSFFKFKIRNPKVSSSTFEAYIEGHKCVHISDLRPTTVIKADSWTTAGVVVAREVRKSANGKDYLIWKMHDLKDCQQPPVVVLLFGEAFKEHWKLQPGICVALMTPVIADNDKNPNAGADKFKPKSSRVTLKVFKPVQIVELGYSTDLGTCKGVKLDGQRCSNFVNVSFSEYCIHHVMKEVRKLSANRGTFNSAMSVPPPKNPANRMYCNPMNRTGLPNKPTSFVSSAGIDGTIRPTTSNVFKSSELKTTSKEEEKQTLQEIITHRSHTLGARNMRLLADSKKGKTEETATKVNTSSMADFIKVQSAPVRPILRSPRLGSGLGGSGCVTLTASSKPTSSPSDPAKLRAIAIMKRNKDQPTSSKKCLKRQQVEDANDSLDHKRSKLSPLENGIDLDALLKRKSIHDKDANKAQGLEAQKHLDSLEAREKVETFVSECMSVKDVKVVSCKKCGYTAQRQSDLCMRQGHCVTHTTAEKRFFKCGGCQRRTTAFSMMPTKPCKHCDANQWIRVAMKDERKVKLENEKLLVRDCYRIKRSF